MTCDRKVLTCWSRILTHMDVKKYDQIRHKCNTAANDGNAYFASLSLTPLVVNQSLIAEPPCTDAYAQCCDRGKPVMVYLFRLTRDLHLGELKDWRCHQP